MKKRLISLYMESKENFFLAKSVWFSYLKHVCVCMCVHMHVSVCRMVMFNLLESHSNTLSPISSNFFFRTACYRFQEPQVQVVQTMVVNQLCVSNPPTSSETYDIGAVSWRFCVRNQLIGFLKHEETQENWKNCMHFHQRKKQRCYPWRPNSWSSCELYTVMIPIVIRFKMVHMYKILLQIVTIKFGRSLENSEDNVMVRCQPCGSKKLAMLQDSTWQTWQRKNLLVVENSPFIHEILLK